MTRLTAAVVGTGFIGPVHVEALRRAGVHVTGIAASSAEKSIAAAKSLGLARGYGSFEEVLDDEAVMAVHLATPNGLHFEQASRALKAGKHVLCEKPIGLSSEEGQQLVDAAAKHDSLKVMEAFMYRHHPQLQRTKQIIGSGGVGELRTIQSFFSYFNDDPNNIRNQQGMGGGGLMDIGCYNISLSRFLFNCEPTRVLGLIEFDPNFGTDRISSGVMEFPNGTSTFTCSMQMVPYQRMNAFGTTGRVEIEIPFNAPPDRPCKIWHQSGEEVEEICLNTCDQYTVQGDLFAEAVFNDTPVPTKLSDAVDNMKVLEAIFKSAETNAWVEV